MPSLFSSSSNRVLRGALLAAALLLVAVPLALMGWVRSPYALGLDEPIPQPVPFDHRHHVRDNGMDCRYCHWSVEEAPSAGIPATELCMNCHGQVLNDSPLLAPVRQSAEEDRPIRWARVHRLPDFVYFDHSVHARGGVGCETCHGRVDRMPRVYQTEPLTMGWCLECHRNPDPHLRPLDEITTMGYRPAGGGLRSGFTSGRPGVGEAAPDSTDDTSDAPPGGIHASEAGGEIPRVSPGTDCTTCHR